MKIYLKTIKYAKKAQISNVEQFIASIRISLFSPTVIVENM